jgi:hypothetical protein
MFAVSGTKETEDRVTAYELGAGFFCAGDPQPIGAIADALHLADPLRELAESKLVVHGRWGGLGTRLFRLPSTDGEIVVLTWREFDVWELSDAADQSRWNAFGRAFAAACLELNPVGAVLLTSPTHDVLETLGDFAQAVWARDFGTLLDHDRGTIYVNPEDAARFLFDHPELAVHGTTLDNGGFLVVGDGRPPFDLD